MKHFRGFTLIELMVSVGVVAVVALAATAAINPTEVIRESRDSNRVSDVSSLGIALADYQSLVGGSLGSSSTVYISIPDPLATSTAGDQCQGLGLAAMVTGTGYVYHCAASSSLRNVDGTGWIPLNFKSMTPASPITILPIDPVNTTSSNEYYEFFTDGTRWKLITLPESAKQNTTSTIGQFIAGTNMTLGGGFPTGWIPVPGNSTFGTSYIWIMKYAGKCVSAASGVSLTSPQGSSGYTGLAGFYDNNVTACTAANGDYVASTPAGYQIGNISQTDAIGYCGALGSHLINNNEWQTVAWNAENVASNWDSGVVGSGNLFYGNSAGNVTAAVQASPDDTQGYYAETSSTLDQRRTLTLSNGSVEWDMAGNGDEWLSNTIQGNQEPHPSSQTGWNYNWWESDDVLGALTTKDIGTANAAWTGWSTQGMGILYTENSATDTGTYAFTRGGWWAAGLGVAGIDELIMNAGPSAIGGALRCVR